MFAYCNNNPVKYSDSTGQLPFFANVARSTGTTVYSIQNIAGISIKSTWATVEYPILKGINIIYGIAEESGIIQLLP